MTVTHPVANPSMLTVYGAEWCGDCRRAKRWLAAHEIDYAWVDVAAQPDIRTQLTQNGYPAIPVIVLADGRILMEPSDDELDAELDAVSLAPAR